MGRPRKLLSQQKGHLKVEQQLEKAAAETAISVGQEQLNTPPDWLIDEKAIAEFRRVVKEFRKIEVIGNLDLNNIAGYCNAFALYVKATGDLKGLPLLAQKELVEIQNKYAAEMRKFAALCGLTIDSRLKIGAKKAQETQQEIEDTFGDI